MSNSIAETVKELVAEQLGVETKHVVNESRFVEDLGADSLDAVELVMCIEDEFDLEISEEDAEKMVTVQDVIDYVIDNT